MEGMDFVEIDGSSGEGGGQILRTSLTLSILYQIPIRIYNIRANRSVPGLQAQHLAAVKVASEICRASVSDVAKGTRDLTFIPGGVRAGSYRVDIRTAGAVSLVLQTIALPLMVLGEKKSSVVVTGGTHVPHSPIYEYLNEIWAHTLNLFGYKIKLTLNRMGFFPRGGGEISAILNPVTAIKPGEYLSKEKLTAIRGTAVVSKLDPQIAKRMKHEALKIIEPYCRDIKIAQIEIEALDAGAYIFLYSYSENSPIRIGISSLGIKGKRAEQVADEAVNDLIQTNELPGVFDRHLADQVLLPLVIADTSTQITTNSITSHLLTNAAIINLFKPNTIEIIGESGKPGLISVTP